MHMHIYIYIHTYTHTTHRDHLGSFTPWDRFEMNGEITAALLLVGRGDEAARIQRERLVFLKQVIIHSLQPPLCLSVSVYVCVHVSHTERKTHVFEAGASLCFCLSVSVCLSLSASLCFSL
jgi:hypothetical protein